MNKILSILAILLSISLTLNAKDIAQIKNNKWTNLNLYRGLDQRVGPYAYDDTYLEFEFGGRYEWLDLYGYIDYLDVFNDSSSGKHGQDNFFADIEPRISIDYITGIDLSYGILDELFFAFDLYYADAPPNNSKGLKELWMGLGSNLDFPWLGMCGINFYTRYVNNNYGASNEGGFDGYDVHINWFKPLYFFNHERFLTFQGYSDYEFASKMPGNTFEQTFRTNDSFQAYFGFWLHDPKWAIGYGIKAYNNMTQWKDGQNLNGKETDTSGLANYFNLTYKF